MLRLITALVIFVLCFTNAFTQTHWVTVIADQANLRGTPDTSGLVVQRVIKGDEFELIKKQDAWFLVQTPKYVGWLHGNTIEYSTARHIVRQNRPKPLPDDTALDDAQDSPFEAKYVGGNSAPTLFVKNDTDRIVTLVIGGVKYTIQSRDTIEVEVDAGIYAYTATAPRARPYTGRDRFENGHEYTWSFYIQTIRN